MPQTYHLGIDKKNLRGATTALVPGDPARSAMIAERVAKVFGADGGNVERLAVNREFTTHLCRIKGRYVAVTSTGIGAPSASIAIEELARLGVATFIRVGTSGAIQKNIVNGDVIITTGSVRLDGASRDYAPIEYPAVADFSVTEALVRGAKKAGAPYHVGITATSATFYPGEERTDAHAKSVIRRLRGQTAELRSLNVLNYEMESSVILTMASTMGLKAGCVTGVVNRAGDGRVTNRSLRAGEKNAIDAAILGVAELIDD